MSNICSDLAARLDGLGAAGLLAVARDAVRRAAALPVETGDADGLVEAVGGWYRLGAAVHAQQLRHVAAVEREQAYRGKAHSSVNLWVAQLGVSRGEAKALVGSALALERLPETAARHAEGLLGAGHVAEATRALAAFDQLTEGSRGGEDDGEDADGRLAAAVAELDALVVGQVEASSGEDGDRRPVGRQVLRQRLEALRHEHAPELLAEQQERLRARRSLRLDRANDPDRTPTLNGSLAHTTYTKARAMIHALARQHAAGDPRSFTQRCHDAFDRILDLAAATGQLPDLAGDQPRVLLVVQAETLQPAACASGAEVPAALLDGYGAVDASTARLLCCDAEVTEVVLNRQRDVLQVGRDRRRPNRAQRRAVFARDGACIGCGAPLAYCQVHHIVFWSDGGPTDVDNLVAVCWDCHARIHHADWQVTRSLEGRYRLQPPSRGHIQERPPDRLAG